MESLKKRFIESSSFYTNCEKEDPFSDFKINDSSFLDTIPSRGTCPLCNRSRKYYCYNCYVPVEEVANRLPTVKLPVKIDIIKHPKEVDGKSTSAHAAVLAPDDVKLYVYPHFPSYENEKVLLIFPGKAAVPFQEWWTSASNKLIKDNSCNMSLTDENDSNCVEVKSQIADGLTNLPFNKVVFIDSTWRQSKALYSDPRLNELPSVVLSSYKSLFWRYYRGKQDTHLSTVEAVYYFLVELHSLSRPEEAYAGQFDNILFFFKFMYFKIRTLYDPLKLKAYCGTNS